MQSTRRPTEPHDDDPSELDARALDLEAEAATLRARAIRLRRAKPTVQATPAPTAETLLTTPQMAKRLGVSGVTLGRAMREEGCPAIPVGRSVRWDPTTTIAWFASRGRRAMPRPVPTPDEDDIDVSAAVRSAGLVAIGGGGRR